MSLAELSRMDGAELKEFFDSFDTVLTDCDGVLWVGNNAIDGSVDMIDKFRSIGKRVIYVTNNATKSRDEYVEKCCKLGFGGKREDIFTTSYLVASYLKSIGFDKKVYLLGPKGIARELDAAAISHIGLGPDPVASDGWSVDVAREICGKMEDGVGCVVASIDYDISYAKLMKAATYANRPGTIYIATNLDSRFPAGPGCLVPGTGSLVCAVTTASGIQPKVLGKPENFVFDTIKAEHPDIDAARTLMIGDNYETDILLGKNCLLKTLMVGTGVHSLEEVAGFKSSQVPEKQRLVPDYYVGSLGELLTLANKACS